MGRDNMGYGVWWNKINAVVEGKLGVGLLDLPDLPYREWYDDGKSPGYVVGRVVRLVKEDW